MDPLVGSAVIATSGEDKVSDSSDNADLLDFCFLCSRQFFHENLDDYGTERLKDEEVLESFFEELGPVDRSLLQCCPSCKALCKTLIRTKEALSSLIDEIFKLLLRSRKVSYLVSKSRVVSRLFQSSNASLPPCEASSSFLQPPFPNFPKDCHTNAMCNSNTSFPSQFDLRLDSSNLSDSLDLPLSHYPTTPLTTVAVTKKSPLSKEMKQEIGSCSGPVPVNSAFSAIYNDSIMNSVSDNACDADAVILKSCAPHKRDTPNPDVIYQSAATAPKCGTNKGEIGNKDKQNEALPKIVKPKMLEDAKPSRTPRKKQTKHNCTQCNKSFQNARNLRHHQSAHVGERKFICELCGASYRNKSGLEAHVAIHKGESKFKCDTCGKLFTQNSGLQRHMALHTKKYDFQCDMCGKQFLHHTSLKAHKLSHEGTKHFECPNCDLKFSQKSHLQRHIKVHTGEKQHKCPLCDRAFSEKYNLKVHIKSHPENSANLLRHKCTQCPKEFTRKFKLKQHTNQAHKN